MSQLFYEITGRSPRKRRLPMVMVNPIPAKIRRPALYPHTLFVAIELGWRDW